LLSALYLRQLGTNCWCYSYARSSGR
jgi:hypothetical protein